MGTLQIILLAFAAYIGLYAIVDRICKTIDNRSISNTYIAALKSDEEKTTDDNGSPDVNKTEKQWSILVKYFWVWSEKSGFYAKETCTFQVKIWVSAHFYGHLPVSQTRSGHGKTTIFRGFAGFLPTFPLLFLIIMNKKY